MWLRILRIAGISFAALAYLGGCVQTFGESKSAYENLRSLAGAHRMALPQWPK
jgi:hypothetical protein